MVAVVGHVHPHAASGLDDVRALRDGNLLAVDYDGDQVGLCGLYHRARVWDPGLSYTSSGAPSALGALFDSGYALNSSPNLAMKLWVGHAQASPNAQIVRPAIWSATLFRSAPSSVRASPWTIRPVIFFIQSEPSRQGVHCPQLSWE